jgi:hypothetical protein
MDLLLISDVLTPLRFVTQSVSQSYVLQLHVIAFCSLPFFSAQSSSVLLSRLSVIPSKFSFDSASASPCRSDALPGAAPSFQDWGSKIFAFSPPSLRSYPRRSSRICTNLAGHPGRGWGSGLLVPLASAAPVLYYWNSHLIKHQVITQASKVCGAFVRDCSKSSLSGVQ